MVLKPAFYSDQSVQLLRCGSRLAKGGNGRWEVKVRTAVWWENLVNHSKEVEGI